MRQDLERQGLGLPVVGHRTGATNAQGDGTALRLPVHGPVPRDGDLGHGYDINLILGAQDTFSMLKREDRELLRLLETNARCSNAALARRLGISRTTVQNRIERLEEAGVIAGYTVRFGPDADREHVRAHVMIRASPGRTMALQRTLESRHELRALYSISGDFDLIGVVVANDTCELDEVLHWIRGLDGVVETTTSILLSALFNR